MTAKAKARWRMCARWTGSRKPCFKDRIANEFLTSIYAAALRIYGGSENIPVFEELARHSHGRASTFRLKKTVVLAISINCIDNTYTHISSRHEKYPFSDSEEL